MGRRRGSPSDRRLNNAQRSKHSTARRNPRKSRRSHQPHPSKPSSSSWKVFGFERRPRCITSGMRSEESSVRNFWSSRRKRSKQANCCRSKSTGEQRQATRGAGRLPGLLVGPDPSINGSRSGTRPGV
jgi:hypothetical protein